jgi:hypothetical protein
MKSMTVEEVREYCFQQSKQLSFTSDGSLCYGPGGEDSFFVKHPPEHRRIVRLIYDLLTSDKQNGSDEGVVWIYGWHLGVTEMIRAGWAILIDMRRARDDFRSLEIAPAQYFGGDDFIELHAFLIQIVAWGWPACYVPRGGKFFVEFRSTERAFFYSDDAATLNILRSALAPWEPSKEDRQETRSLAVLRFEAAEKRMDEADYAGAAELFRSSLLADTELYDAARGLIRALQMSGRDDEAALIESRLAEFTSEE